MRIWIVPAAVFLLLSLAPIVMAQGTYDIRPGGDYTVHLSVRKPSYVILRDGQWEVRAYYYSGTSCFSDGSWSEGFYTGWYQHRVIGDEWLGSPEEKSLVIHTKVVSYPRNPEDIAQGMREIPIGQSVTFRLRLIIKNINPVFSGGAGEEAGYVIFSLGAATFQYQYTKVYDDYVLQGPKLPTKINLDSAGKYRLVIDKDMTANVSETAPERADFYVDEPIEIDLVSTSRPEEPIDLPAEVKLTVAGVSIAAAVGAGAYIVLSKKVEAPIPEE
ncbi:MAG: hypothetical protein QW179_00335 [Candidatus Hadarchaeales archaeon]